MQTTWGATSAYCVDAGGVGRRIPGGSRDFASDKGNKRRDIGWPVWYAGGSSKGVVEGVLNGEELGEGMVLVVSEANAEDVRGWGGTRGSDVGDDGFLPKVRGGVSEDRACGGGLEGLRVGDELLDKSDRDTT